MRYLLGFVLAVAMCSGSVQAKAWFDVVDGQIIWGDWSLDSWGLEWPDAFSEARDTPAMLSILRTWNNHGLNTLLVSAQSEKWSLYGPDGQVADAAAGERYKTVLDTTRFHQFPTLVSLFSARRANQLASPEAYKKAMATAVQRLPEDYYGVLVVGDAVSGQKWGADHPFPLDKPANVLALCRAIPKRPGTVLLGVPADIFPGAPREGSQRPLIYAARKVDALEKLAGHLSRPNAGPIPADLAKDIAVFRADQMLRRIDAGPSLDAAIQTYLQQVEKTRLAVQAPPMAADKPVGPADAPLTPEEKTEGFKPLFDGRSLEGWTTLRTDWGAWTVQDGMIYCRGSRLGPWLRTRRRYESFVLRLEFRISERGNSGVFVHAPLDGRVSRFGFELQIMGRRADKLDDHNPIGAIYAAVPPLMDPFDAAIEWYKEEVTFRGSHLTLRVNGHLLQDIDVSANPLLKDRLHAGFIGLQDHGNKVWFRKIRIKELPPADR